MIIERLIRDGKVWEVEHGPRAYPGAWHLQSATILREVEPTDEEREQIAAAQRVMEHIKQSESKQ